MRSYFYLRNTWIFVLFFVFALLYFYKSLPDYQVLDETYVDEKYPFENFLTPLNDFTPHYLNNKETIKECK